MDFDQSRPIVQIAEASQRTHLICVPAYDFSRSVSPFLFSLSSPFYEAYLSRHANQFTTSSCQHCNSEHTSQRFCLPPNYSPVELNFLLDFIEQTPQATLRPGLLFSLIRLCDYLLIAPHVIFDLIQIYIPRHFRTRSRFTEDLVAVLSNTSY